jgi:hypothetical protein
VAYNYFRVQQELAKLILSSLSSKLSIEEADELDHHQLAPLMINAESPSMNDLYQIGDKFRIWLADTDIRQRDAEYNKLLSDELRLWADENIFDANDPRRG